MQYFAVHGVECAILPLPTNEANKGFELVFEIARHLEEFKLNRYFIQIHASGCFFLACYRRPCVMLSLSCYAVQIMLCKLQTYVLPYRQAAWLANACGHRN